MRRNQIMFQNIKVQLILPENFESIGIFLGSVSFAQIGNMSLCFFIEGESGIFIFALRGGDKEEFSDFGAGQNDSVDIFGSDLFIAEIVKDCNGGVDIKILFDFKWWEELSFIIQIFLFEQVVKLFIAHVFGLFRNNIFSVVHNFENRFVHSETLS